MPRIEDLPYDIFPLIFAHVPNRSTVYNACMVCKTFAEVSIPSLYSMLDLKLTITGLNSGPWDAMKAKPERYDHVHHVHIVPDNSSSSREVREEYAQVLPRLVNLRSAKFLWSKAEQHLPRDYVTTLAHVTGLLARLPRLTTFQLAGDPQRPGIFAPPCQSFPHVLDIILHGTQPLWSGEPTHTLGGPGSGYVLSRQAAETAQRIKRFAVVGRWPELIAPQRCFSMLKCLSEMTNLVRLDLTRLFGIVPMNELLPVLLRLRKIESLSMVYVLDPEWVPLAITQTNCLPCLSALTVAFRSVARRAEFDTLWRWILDFTRYRPLQQLTVAPLRKQGCKLRKSMMDCIRSHRASLRLLRLEYTIIPQEHLRILLVELPDLTEVAFSANKAEIAGTFSEDERSRQLVLEKLDMRFDGYYELFDSEEAEILMRSIPHLRHLVVNKTLWERAWVLRNGVLHREISETVKFREDNDLLFS